MVKRMFVKQSEITASPEVIFAWHEQPGIVEKLTPPWERVEILESGNGLQVGTRIIFKVFTGPLWKLWVAEHREYDPPHLFADIQRQGPFAYWYHRHRFDPVGQDRTLMTDEIEYSLPMGWLGEAIGFGFVREKLERMFDYRHQVVRGVFLDSSQIGKTDLTAEAQRSQR